MSAIQSQFIAGVRVRYVCPPNADENQPPFVFIHGAWGNPVLFDGWLEYCAQHGIRAYAVNLKPADGVSIYDYAVAVHEFVSAIGPVVFIGHSMGGLIAQMVAEKQQLVKAVVLVASAPCAGTKNRFKKNPLFWFHPFYTKAMVTGKKFIIRKKHALSHILNGTENPETVYAMFRSESGLVFREIVMGVKVEHITCPVLVITGKQDKMLPMPIQESLIEKYEASSFQVDTDHMIQLNDRNVAIGHIIGWAQRKLSTQGFKIFV